MFIKLNLKISFYIDRDTLEDNIENKRRFGDKYHHL